jgi:hypothetical protein
MPTTKVTAEAGGGERGNGWRGGWGVSVTHKQQQQGPPNTCLQKDNTVVGTDHASWRPSEPHPIPMHGACRERACRHLLLHPRTGAKAAISLPTLSVRPCMLEQPPTHSTLPTRSRRMSMSTAMMLRIMEAGNGSAPGTSSCTLGTGSRGGGTGQRCRGRDDQSNTTVAIPHSLNSSEPQGLRHVHPPPIRVLQPNYPKGSHTRVLCDRAH